MTLRYAVALRRLTDARTARQLAVALEAFDITADDLTRVLHVPVSAEVRLTDEAAVVTRLEQLRTLVTELSDSLTPRGVSQWLHTQLRALAGRTPIDVLADGAFEQVTLAARSFLGGAYI